jgi:hypothetical protein
MSRQRDPHDLCAVIYVVDDPVVTNPESEIRPVPCKSLDTGRARFRAKIVNDV